MKRSNTRDISSFFTKKPTTENASQVQTSEENPIPEINITRAPQPSAQGSSPSVTIPPPVVVDIVNLSHDPGKRKKLIDFHPNERDLVRRMYIQRGPCQPVDHVFPKILFGTKERRFNVKWFDSSWRPWLEYSVFKDAAFCFICYLFKAENTAGGDAFVSEGFKAWNRIETIRDHVGKHTSSHNNAVIAIELFTKQKGSIVTALSKQTDEIMSAYRKRLEASITAIRWLLLQGLPFRGHDESENSMNRGNFISLLALLSEHDPEYSKVVLKMAPGNCQLTSSIVQKDIINACAKETTKAILEELNGGFFAILADESADISDKEQMALCLRYVNKKEVSDTIDSNKAQSITHLLMSFDFVFVAHLMVAIFGITNELNVALQKHDQDIVNAMSMVDITKTSLQKMRDEGWNLHMDKVTSFMVKYGVEVPNMEANYIVPGRRMYQNMKTRRE
ncbi:zinc finger MYM-type protein 1-like [Heracleum sosnowskyi]|uniref:Zinc finger MYM-type protein 1-like n=1 Tax=Heracleum sosnowskyi TaxID=360622 RepID=A0AAD8I2H8_9APIA|nr:zinc finger MYM-type protein 1-like [Heracleum sosnowskyi]